MNSFWKSYSGDDWQWCHNKLISFKLRNQIHEEAFEHLFCDITVQLSPANKVFLIKRKTWERKFWLMRKFFPPTSCRSGEKLSPSLISNHLPFRQPIVHYWTTLNCRPGCRSILIYDIAHPPFARFAWARYGHLASWMPQRPEDGKKIE